MIDMVNHQTTGLCLLLVQVHRSGGKEVSQAVVWAMRFHLKICSTCSLGQCARSQCRIDPDVFTEGEEVSKEGSEVQV